MVLGYIKIKEFLEKTKGEVRGSLASDGKHRYYAADYQWKEDRHFPESILVSRANGTGEEVRLKNEIVLDEPLVSFFGLYSGDGAKGSEDPTNIGQVRVSLSFSQRESNLVNFAVAQFRRLFSDSVRFVFSLGEDSAYFMAGEGYNLLREYYKGILPDMPPLAGIRPRLNKADERYLGELRYNQGSPEEDLAFYYFHKPAMEHILTEAKNVELQRVNTPLKSEDRVTASLRRPFKKGARQRGGSSRSDETHVGGVNGMGELFLKILHEIEESILNDTSTSPQGLIQWNDSPSQVGEMILLSNFFQSSPYGQIGGERPDIKSHEPGMIHGQWRRSMKITLHAKLRIDPLWCYTSGLYLAEGTSKKPALFAMFRERPSGFSLGFTSSENTSLELIFRALQRLFLKEDCVTAWKVKVGSQYFPELVVIGLKNAVPMLRGGASGDGKMRTMELSLAVKEWGLGVAPALRSYEGKYSHVEPTGAGVPRIDFWASSALCKWYFPLIMYATFGEIVTNPAEEFTL